MKTMKPSFLCLLVIAIYFRPGTILCQESAATTAYTQLSTNYEVILNATVATGANATAAAVTGDDSNGSSNGSTSAPLLESTPLPVKPGDTLTTTLLMNQDNNTMTSNSSDMTGNVTGPSLKKIADDWNQPLVEGADDGDSQMTAPFILVTTLATTLAVFFLIGIAVYTLRRRRNRQSGTVDESNINITMIGSASPTKPTKNGGNTSSARWNSYADSRDQLITFDHFVGEEDE